MTRQPLQARGEAVIERYVERARNRSPEAVDIMPPRIWASPNAMKQSLQGELGRLFVLERSPVVETGSSL